MLWVFAFSVAIAGAIFYGPWGVLVGFTAAAIFGKILSILFSGRKPKSKTPPPLPTATESVSRTASPTRQGASRKTKIEWHPAKSPVRVADIEIHHGLIYTCEHRLDYLGEPSAINTTLSIARIADDPSNDMGYYPSYESITPSQRRTYLEWLANGRTDSDPSSRALGYLFLFFYGLERRVLFEKDYSTAILEEILRLLAVYGPVAKSRSLRNYFLQLANFTAWHTGIEGYRQVWPSIIEFEGDRPSEDRLRFIFANLFQRGEPLDWTMAYRLALVNEDCRKSVVVSRAREQFWDLFQKRYYELFPSGLILQATKQESLEKYTAASSSLLYGAAKNSDLCLRIPNVFGLRKQFSEIPTLWNSCIDDLSGFSRVVSSKRSGNEVKAWLSLPSELRKPDSHPLRAEFDTLLSGAHQELGYFFIQTGTLADLAGIEKRGKLSPAQSRELSEFVDGLGFSLAPDARFTGVPLTWDQELILFTKDGEPNEQLPALMSLLFLSVAIAAADGVIEAEEMARFNTLVEPEVPSPASWAHLRATQEILRRDGGVATRSVAQVAKRIPGSRREFVLKVLLHVAGASGQIGPDEMKALRKIARAFELDAELPVRMLQEDAAFGEVQVSAKSAGRREGEKIPQKPIHETFRLDAERIQALTAETREVLALLSEVMVEDDVEASAISVAQASAQSVSLPDWAQALEPRFRAAFLEIINFDAMDEDQFASVATKYHLMPDNLFDAINTWSDEVLGDFLLERDGEIRVFRNLLPENELLQAAA